MAALIPSAAILFFTILLPCAIAQQGNTAPETIQMCYKNTTALNRANRQPLHISNLIAIIRKIEEKDIRFRKMETMAATIVKTYQFDGIYYDPGKSSDLQYSPYPDESIKTKIVHDLIPNNGIVIPNGLLDNDERCALHWMVSHSLNATLRDDENVERYQRYNDGGLRAKRSLIGNTRKSRRPVETGTVYTEWGTVSAGRVIAGIAAGLLPQQQQVIWMNNGGSTDPGQNTPTNTGGSGGSNGYPGTGGTGSTGGNSGWNNWNNNNNPQYNRPWQQYPGRKKRQVTGGTTFQPLQNLHAATIAGDVGQAAILNAPYNQRIGNLLPPVGAWNDTICPREYILDELQDPTASYLHEHDTWTYMTGAEIRGGMDGLILGTKAKDLLAKGFTLSQVLEMYYSNDGIYGDNTVRSCDRSSIFPGLIDPTVLREQSRSFAYLYNLNPRKVVVIQETLNTFTTLVEQSFAKMQNFQSFIASDPQCTTRPPTSGYVIPDQEKEAKVIATIYPIPDHSTTYDEIVAQQRFIAKLAFDFDVSPTGSRLGMVDGRTGQVLISPNWTDNAPILACRILRQPQGIQPMNLPQVLRTLKTDLVRVQDEQRRRGELPAVGSRITVLVFVQGKKLEESQRDAILTQLREYERDLGDVQITYTSSKFVRQDFERFMLDPTNQANYIPIQATPSGNLSDGTTAFMKEFTKSNHGSLSYAECNEYQFPDQSKELLESENIFVEPADTILYYKIDPSEFFSSVDMRLRFTSQNGKVRICTSRYEQFPVHYSTQENLDRKIECNETSGNYAEPASMRKDVEFIITKPCPYRKDENCLPIYLSITATEVPVASGGVGLDCSIEGCRTPDEVKVTWTHYGMRCNGAYSFNSFFGPSTILSILLSVFYMYQRI